MFCNKCGAQMGDADRFCPACGAPNPKMAQAQPGPAVPPAQATSVPGPQQAPGPQQVPGAAWNPGPAPQPSVIPGYYPKGCLSQAFEDITKVPGVMKRIVQIALLPAAIAFVSLLALVIPVIGWIACPIGLLLSWCAGICCNGYAIEWGRELSRGRGFDASGSILRSSLFSLGFFSSSLSSLLSLLAFVPMIVGWFILVFGSIGIAAARYSIGMSGLEGLLVLLVMGLYAVSGVASIFLSMFSDASVMHLAVTGRVESGFALGRVWKTFKSQLGKLFCASVLPGLIAGAVLAVAIMVLVFILLAVIASSVSSMGYGYSYSYSYNPIQAIVSGGFVTLLIIGLIAFAASFVGAFVSVLKYRAVGYWAQRYAPEWTHEGDADYTFRLPVGHGPASASGSVPGGPVQ